MDIKCTALRKSMDIKSYTLRKTMDTKVNTLIKGYGPWIMNAKYSQSDPN